MTCWRYSSLNRSVGKAVFHEALLGDLQKYPWLKKLRHYHCKAKHGKPIIAKIHTPTHAKYGNPTIAEIDTSARLQTCTPTAYGIEQQGLYMYTRYLDNLWFKGLGNRVLILQKVADHVKRHVLTKSSPAPSLYVPFGKIKIFHFLKFVGYSRISAPCPNVGLLAYLPACLPFVNGWCFFVIYFCSICISTS